MTGPRVLAIDATGDAVSIAAGRSGAAVVRVETVERSAAARLFPAIDEALRSSGYNIDDFDRFAAATGPGGFTGVRLGVAAVRGFALALGRPAIGIDGFAAIAEAARRAGLDAALIVFGRPPRLLWRWSDDDTDAPIASGDHEACASELRRRSGSRAIGPGADPSSDLAFQRIDPRVLLDLAATAPIGAAPAPFYARPPDAMASKRPPPPRLD